jgi:uncharacterized protein YdaL
MSKNQRECGFEWEGSEFRHLTHTIKTLRKKDSNCCPFLKVSEVKDSINYFKSNLSKFITFANAAAKS